MFFRTEVLNVRTKLFANPLDAAWKGVVLTCLMPLIEQNFSKWSDTNCGPLPLTIVPRMPSIENIADRAAIVSLDVVFAINEI